MAKEKGGNKKETKEKGPKAKKSYNIYKLYEVQGDKLVRKNKFSPKADGCFLAEHKDRVTCGKSGYMEKKSK